MVWLLISAVSFPLQLHFVSLLTALRLAVQYMLQIACPLCSMLRTIASHQEMLSKGIHFILCASSQHSIASQQPNTLHSELLLLLPVPNAIFV